MFGVQGAPHGVGFWEAEERDQPLKLLLGYGCVP